MSWLTPSDTALPQGLAPAGQLYWQAILSGDQVVPLKQWMMMTMMMKYIQQTADISMV